MQKIVIDTNVIVSALIQRSYPYLIVDSLFIEQKFQLCISDELVAEYHEVLGRRKFARFQDFFVKAESLLFQIEINAIKFAPTLTLELISDDDDDMLLELAEECGADFIITGNTTDFTFPAYKQTRIVTPKEYWDNYRPDILK